MALKIYVEGGGDSREQKIRCREGFSKLLAKAGFAGRMPGIVACGSRQATFDKFKTAVATDNAAVLLVDSEDPVTAKTAWDHLNKRDGWDRPADCTYDQAQLMVTSMETWISADHPTLRRVFRDCLRENALLPLYHLEGRQRMEVLDALVRATVDCGRTRQYRKGRRSFQVLAELNPDTLMQHVPHFRALIEVLRSRL